MVDRMSPVVDLSDSLRALVLHVSRYVLTRCLPSAAAQMQAGTASVSALSSEDANLVYDHMERGLLIPYQLFPRKRSQV